MWMSQCASKKCAHSTHFYDPILYIDRILSTKKIGSIYTQPSIWWRQINNTGHLLGRLVCDESRIAIKLGVTGQGLLHTLLTKFITFHSNILMFITYKLLSYVSGQINFSISFPLKDTCTSRLQSYYWPKYVLIYIIPKGGKTLGFEITAKITPLRSLYFLLITALGRENYIDWINFEIVPLNFACIDISLISLRSSSVQQCTRFATKIF